MQLRSDCPSFDQLGVEFPADYRIFFATELPVARDVCGGAFAMNEAVFDRVEKLLKSQNLPFSAARHKPVYTSEEAAAVRGVPLSTGAKALICKGEDRFVMFVIPADRKLDGKQVRRMCGWRKLRFANREEVLTLTGLTPGSIPPFGSLFGLPTFCDQKLGENKTINFNAGDHTISVSMRYADYFEAEKPELGNFTEEGAFGRGVDDDAGQTSDEA
jgi:Ala-tRNA(Pro) deacylase